MTAEMQIIKLTSQLEEAGGMGLLAAGMLAPFLAIQRDNPGAFSGTNTGFVWSKTLGGGFHNDTVPFGIGDLRINSDLFSATVGVELTDGLPSNINVLIALGEGGGDDVILEINPNIAVLADKILDPDDITQQTVVGYQNPGATLEIPLSLAAIEFTFHLDLHTGDIRSSMVMHSMLADFASSQIGIFELNLNKVIVFPKLGDLGLYVKKLFIDFTENASTNFTKMFPEVYDPSWKGFGAEDITLLYPIDQTPGSEEFINGAVRGFMYGIDQGFSGTFHVDYTVTDHSKWLGKAFGEIEIRNGDFLKSTLAVDLNLKKLAGIGEDNANAVELNDDEQDFIDAIADQRRQAAIDRQTAGIQPPPIPDNAYLRCQATLVSHDLGPEKVFGFELSMTDTTIIGSKSTSGPGMDFDGDVAQTIFLTLIFVAGVYLIKEGVEKEDGWLIFAGTLLLFTSVADIFTDGDIFPVLEKLSLSQFGIRYIHVKPDNGPSQRYTEAFVGTKLTFKLDCGLINGIEWLAGELGIVNAFNAGEIFGFNLTNMDLGGYVELGVTNINITDSVPPSHIGRLFERKNIVIKALRMPQLHFKENDETKGSVVIPKIEPIIKNRDGGVSWYGLGLLLSPQTGPSATLDFPAGGIVFYFKPEFDIEFVAQLAKKPGVTYLIPEFLLAKGTVDINKPIPAFGGTQNRIAIDVGAFSSLPPLVNPSAKDKATRKKELLLIKNYKQQYSGEYAWGTALPAEGPPVSYDFAFAQLGYQGKSPLLTLGNAGLFGFDLIYGFNIAPGYPGGKPTAMGIADWITAGSAQTDPFDNIRDWPDVPTSAKWHPDIYWEPLNQEFKNKHVAGFTMNVGSANDGGKSYNGDALLLMGFREFWMAAAIKAKLKPINLSATAMFVMDDGDWLFRFIAKFKKNDDGSFILAKFPVEFGSSSTPDDKSWFYFGHYDKKYGGPATVEIFKKRIVTKFFLVYDSAGLKKFGFMPFESDFKPDIPGPAWGAGGIFQIGPKKYGPSFLNLKLFAAIGFNVAYKHDPTFFFGELYAGGYMQLKVVVIKFKLELLARLQGMAIEKDDRWMGELSIKLNLPWPLSDVEESFDFVIQSRNFTPVPPAGPFSISATGLSRLEARSVDLPTDSISVVPIDSIIAVSFGRPIEDLILPELDNPTRTNLAVNDTDPGNAKLETTRIDYQGVKYEVEYSHVLSDVIISYQPIGGGQEMIVESMVGSWNMPLLDENGQPLEAQDKNHTLYFNSLMPPELQFNSEAIGAFNTWHNTIDHIHPCQLGGSACIMDVNPQPEITFDVVPQAVFDTYLGEIVVNGRQVLDDFALFPENTNRLEWSTSGHRGLVLPFNSWVDTVSASAAQMSLAFLLKGETQIEELSQIVKHLRVNVGIDLRGRKWAERLRFNILFTPNLQAPHGFDVTLENMNFDNQELIVELLGVDGLDSRSPGCQIGITTVEEKALIKTVHITGYNVLLDPEVDWQNAGDIGSNILTDLANSELLLNQFCIERAQFNPGSWDTITTGSDGEPPTSDGHATENLLNNHLFKPGHHYKIDYTLTTTSKSIVVKDDEEYGEEFEGETKVFSTHQTAPGVETIAPIEFKTESAPTQTVAKYVGFTLPNGLTQPVYPASAVPLISLKYNGLIRYIYLKHYDAEVLNPQMVDVNGDPILPEQTGMVDLLSSPSDQVLEEILETCVPEAQWMVYSQIISWVGKLLPDMHYSLQMVDTSDPNETKYPVNEPFKTSRYASFADHVGAIGDLAQLGKHEPVTDSMTAGTDIANFISLMTHFDGAAYSFDGAIERFYRDILSQDGGRLGKDPNQDSLTYLVGLDPADPAETVVWGVVIELTETLLSKDGVAFNIESGFELWQNVGLHKTTDGYLILQDNSAGRMLILNSADGLTFTPFSQDINLPINFNPEQLVRHEVENYVAATYPQLDEAGQAGKVDEDLAKIKGLNGVGEALTADSQALVIPMPQDV